MKPIRQCWVLNYEREIYLIHFVTITSLLKMRSYTSKHTAYSLIFTLTRYFRQLWAVPVSCAERKTSWRYITFSYLFHRLRQVINRRCGAGVRLLAGTSLQLFSSSIQWAADHCRCPLFCLLIRDWGDIVVDSPAIGITKGNEFDPVEAVAFRSTRFTHDYCLCFNPAWSGKVKLTNNPAV